MHIGIINPLELESYYFKNILCNQRTILISGIEYLAGNINGWNVILVYSGLGKVNAATMCTRLIHDFNPCCIFLSGCAGKINPLITTDHVVIGKNILDVDFGELTNTGMHFKYPNLTELPSGGFELKKTVLPFLNEFCQKHIDIRLGNIATSDSIPNPKQQIDLLNQCKVDVIDMESSAVAQVCWMFNITNVVVRGISNDARDTVVSTEDIISSANKAAEIVAEILNNRSFSELLSN